jgi:hypothetical protein
MTSEWVSGEEKDVIQEPALVLLHQEKVANGWDHAPVRKVPPASDIEGPMWLEYVKGGTDLSRHEILPCGREGIGLSGVRVELKGERLAPGVDTVQCPCVCVLGGCLALRDGQKGHEIFRGDEFRPGADPFPTERRVVDQDQSHRGAAFVSRCGSVLEGITDLPPNPHDFVMLEGFP